MLQLDRLLFLVADGRVWILIVSWFSLGLVLMLGLIEVELLEKSSLCPERTLSGDQQGLEINDKDDVPDDKENPHGPSIPPQPPKFDQYKGAAIPQHASSP
ncbi:hypothetical protein BC939DRAFT_475608 [Gamsiella multidivaricata]|uniref:uncharacterized protein n=1 Tax=Gamsiella multidivaricata TaxID=101098 RepID=UPI00221EBDB6|nr:uncharacterized protein BC939DRAFT_475608 [Gamsiella multidivaricata]KAI7826926.1 hypothetical protein BC939DRAFT_475608 [Gamsiella multidivaricata]